MMMMVWWGRGVVVKAVDGPCLSPAYNKPHLDHHHDPDKPHLDHHHDNDKPHLDHHHGNDDDNESIILYL